jgi:RNA polymerase sigma-70 factor, ECF subfamily
MLVMGDTDVWAEIELLYRTRFGELARVARAISGDRESALESVQDGFADALRNAGQWDGRGPLDAWVWRCVVNRARKARPRPQPGASAENGNGHAEMGDHALRARLAALPERQRLCIFLRYFADLEYKEIAAALGIEVGTVSATLHAAHAALRAELAEVRA